ncbi:Uncharacterised protein [Salmonella enterica subsp. enterica]|uniref:Uncharacterized protein n=1 Tax=Salmonella enterica I TaxID=59201 RepID=A0A447TVV1_SALET|nr:Uncharacterised protein [Salmonella enterica subsp. enterica]
MAFVLGGSVCHFPGHLFVCGTGIIPGCPCRMAALSHLIRPTRTARASLMALRLSGYPAFNVISLFQRVGQRDDMQGVGIVANAEDAFGF